MVVAFFFFFFLKVSFFIHNLLIAIIKRKTATMHQNKIPFGQVCLYTLTMKAPSECELTFYILDSSKITNQKVGMFRIAE